MKETIRKLEEIVEGLEKKIRSNNTTIYLVLAAFIFAAFFLGMTLSEYWGLLSEVIGLKYSYYRVSREQLLKLVQVFGKVLIFFTLVAIGIGVEKIIDAILENRKLRRIVKVLKEVQEEMKSQVRDEGQEQH